LTVHVPFLDEALHSLDQRRRSLEEAIPRLDSLRADPEAVLREQAVVIGPAPQPGMVLALAFLLICGVLPASLAGVRAVFQLLDLNETAGAVAGWLASAAVLFALFRFFRSVLHDAKIVLTSPGVEIHDRRSVVFCPWAVFKGQGARHSRIQKDVVLPLVGSAICLVEKRCGEKTVAEGYDARNRYFYITESGQAVLADSFDVSAFELAGLLFEVRNVLGKQSAVDVFGEQRDQDRLPAESNLDGGWLRVGLNDLAFPPLCCGCRAAASTLVPIRAFRGNAILGRLLPYRPEEAVVFKLPMCVSCASRHRIRCRRYERWFTICGALVPAIVLLGFYLIHRHDMLIFAAICLAGVCGMFGRLVAIELDAGASQFVSTRNASLKTGTVEIRFRDSTYSTVFRVFLDARADR
jgi:hypothetical protein